MLGEVLTTRHCKNVSCYETFISKSPTWTDTLVRHKPRKEDMRFGTWNVRSLYGAGSLTAEPTELARYKLDLVGVQEVKVGQRGHNTSRGL